MLALLACRAPAAAVPVLLAGFAASFAAKLADTFGSEIGKRWGRHTVLITSLRPVPPGTEGAISLEGTAASLAGSVLMTLVLLTLGLIRGWPLALLISGIGLVATLAESVVGASLQQRWGWLSNEVVNGLQTLLAALLAMGLVLWLLPGAG